MGVYAVFFRGNKVINVEDVSSYYKKLIGFYYGDGEKVADVIRKEMGASSVVCALDKRDAILEAADVCGIEGYIEEA